MNEMVDREMTLRDYARVIARRKWVVVAATVATVAAALGMAALQDPVYQASSEVLVRARNTDTIFTNTNSGTFTSPPRSRCSRANWWPTGCATTSASTAARPR
jgi:uncharacterized protein involved in exopolysaccharide biosynthesis